MKPKTTLILVALLVVIAGAAFLFESFGKKSRESRADAIFPAFSVESVDGIDIEDPEEGPVQLRRKGDHWVVATDDDHYAEPKLPSQILEAIAKFEDGILVSTAPDRQSSFEVDAQGIQVRLRSGEKSLAEFVVGKHGPDFNSAYIRRANEAKVYRVPVAIRPMVDRGGESWRKTTLLEVPREQVIAYTTRNSRETVRVESKAEGGWRLVEPIEGDTRADIVSMVLGSMTSIRAVGHADTVPATELGLDADTTSIVIELNDGTSRTITIGAENGRNQSYTRIDGDPSVYLVPRGRWNTIFRPSWALTPEAHVDGEGEGLPEFAMPRIP